MKSFPIVSVTSFCAKGVSSRSDPSLLSLPRSISPICSEFPFAWASTTVISIFIKRKSACLHSARLCQCVDQFDNRTDSAIDSLDFWVHRFDHVVLVGRMRAASMAEAKRSCRQVERLTGEY